MPSSHQEPIDPRMEVVRTAQRQWLDRLIDMSRRNNLLYYQPVQSGTLELIIAPELMDEILSGEAVDLAPLIGQADRRKQGVIQDIVRKALDNAEEKGIATLFLALGQVSWPDPDGGRQVKAPVLLAPITLKMRGQSEEKTQMQLDGSLQFNPVLQHALKRQWGVECDSEALLESTFGYDAVIAADKDNPSAELNALLDELRNLTSSNEGVTVGSFAVISNFSFQKISMYRELQNSLAEMSSNDIVAAIAGDNNARARLALCKVNVDPKTLDSVHPKEEFLVTEADSSQQVAIASILQGQSALLHGPPGTGKSQTITNLISSLAARGKRVLFVAEKRAALEVVLSRLEEAGLGHLAIDLHGAESTPKKVLARVAKSLEALETSHLPDTEDMHDILVDRRTRLNDHVQRMHEERKPTGKSIFHMQGKLLRLPKEATSTLARWRGDFLAGVTPSKFREISDMLAEAAGFEDLSLGLDRSPWADANFTDATAVQSALDLTSRLYTRAIPSLKRGLEALFGGAELKRPEMIRDLGSVLGDLRETDELLDRYGAEAFSPDNSDIHEGLGAARQGIVPRIWHWATDPAFRAAVKKARALCKDKRRRLSELRSDLERVSLLGKRWREYTSRLTPPCNLDNIQEIWRSYEDLRIQVEALVPQKRLLTWPNGTLEALAEEVGRLAADSSTPYRLLAMREVASKLRHLGAGELLEDLRTRRVPGHYWQDSCLYVWYASTLDGLATVDPKVHGFVGKSHSRYVADFQEFDQKSLSKAADRVRRAHAEFAVRAMNDDPEKERLLREQAAKARRHLPLRRLFKEAGQVLTAVCPCWMASPLAVSQLIEGRGLFDYVIFDEASQILPEDAIPAILRGRNIVVAGDSNQLPPTPFFAESYSDDEDEGAAVGYESLMDMTRAFVQSHYLNWHYRSKDERLIAYSNRYIYEDRLTTFPGAGGSDVIQHVLIGQKPLADIDQLSSSPEVNKVVELVIKHAEEHPNVTLGVITMGLKHALRIQHKLDSVLSTRPDLAEFFDTNRPERFFVKNLERVQGDEREKVILSVGYAKDSSGKLPLKFGPLTGMNGRRRLNVAVTRARANLTLLSSFNFTEMDVTKIRPNTGLEFLRGYIEFAASGGSALGRSQTTDSPVNDFEFDVKETLALHGVTCVPQLGCSNFRIDLAAVHPDQPGRYVLAVECDGASYHSSYTARDRDRLRQQHLEKLGWRFHRIWSTDWFLRKEDEVARAIRAFQDAVATAGSGPRSVQEQPRPVTPEPTGRREGQAPLIDRKSIDEYRPHELITLIKWICSDGRLRTNEQLADEVFENLPFKRRGARIDSAIDDAIARYRRIVSLST